MKYVLLRENSFKEAGYLVRCALLYRKSFTATILWNVVSIYRMKRKQICENRNKSDK